MKRQRGRNRKPGGGGGNGGGGGGAGQGNPNRAFESNGPENVKIRGAAQHVYERYQQLARDSFASGDRVLAENYLQHAEHYFRVLRTLQPQRPVSEIAARDAFASGYDIDFEDDGEGDDNTGNEMQEEVAEQPQAFVRDDRNGDYRRDRDYREPRGEQPRGHDQARNDQPRNEAPRAAEPRNGDFRNNEPRSAEPRNGDQPRSGEPRADARTDSERRESRRERFERRRDGRDDRRPRDADVAPADPLAVVEPQAAPLTPPAVQDSSPVLRAQDGAESQMPAFLRQAAVPSTPAPETEAAERPKRTRRRRPEAFEAVEGETPAAAVED
jgi:hypothetical protein